MWNDAIRRQLGAALDMIEAAVAACPEELWSESGSAPAWADRGVVGFWYVAYHALFWLDLYLSGAVEGFTPPAPFDLLELDPSGRLPDRPYERAEIAAYVGHCRRKVAAALAELDERRAAEECVFSWGRVPYGELLLYTLRHTQHHAGQLNLLLRQGAGRSPGWIPVERRRPAG
jgi:hypothetical protein